jgi:hypothetical protein
MPSCRPSPTSPSTSCIPGWAAMRWCWTPRHAALRCAVLHCAVLDAQAGLRCAVLDAQACCTALCCAVLQCAALCCAAHSELLLCTVPSRVVTSPPLPPFCPSACPAGHFEVGGGAPALHPHRPSGVQRRPALWKGRPGANGNQQLQAAPHLRQRLRAGWLPQHPSLKAPVTRACLLECTHACFTVCTVVRL